MSLTYECWAWVGATTAKKKYGTNLWLTNLFLKMLLFFFLFALLNPNDKSKQYTRQYNRVRGAPYMCVCLCIILVYPADSRDCAVCIYVYTLCTVPPFFPRCRLALYFCSPFFFVHCVPCANRIDLIQKQRTYCCRKRQCE